MKRKIPKATAEGISFLIIEPKIIFKVLAKQDFEQLN